MPIHEELFTFSVRWAKTADIVAGGATIVSVRDDRS